GVESLRAVVGGGDVGGRDPHGEDARPDVVVDAHVDELGLPVHHADAGVAAVDVDAGVAAVDPERGPVGAHACAEGAVGRTGDLPRPLDARGGGNVDDVAATFGTGDAVAVQTKPGHLPQVDGGREGVRLAVEVVLHLAHLARGDDLIAERHVDGMRQAG